MSDAESPAETIRRAADLMRERAEAATPGPWSTTAGAYNGQAFPAVLGADGDPEKPATWLMATSNDETQREANAAHAASWHPLVALAVADWLERFGDLTYCYGPAEFDAALAVARAYLGEESA